MSSPFAVKRAHLGRTRLAGLSRILDDRRMLADAIVGLDLGGRVRALLRSPERCHGGGAPGAARVEA